MMKQVSENDATSTILDTFFVIIDFIRFSISHLRWFFKNFSNRKSDSMACLAGKTAIVTGGNSGIGFSTSLLLASRGCNVIIACRRDAKKEVDIIIHRTGNPKITFKPLNLCSLQSVRTFAQEIKNTEQKIDILINNAGALILSEKKSEDGLNALMQTNYFGAFLLTHLLVESLKASTDGRVVFLTSGMAFAHKLTLTNLNTTDFDTDEIMMNTIYPNSKLCNVLAAQEFAKRLKKHRIMVNSADPGISLTPILQPYVIFEGDRWERIILRFIASFFVKDSLVAAQTTFHLATSEKLKNETGEHYFRCKRFRKPIILHDQKFVDDIWKKSEELVQLKPKERL